MSNEDPNTGLAFINVSAQQNESPTRRRTNLDGIPFEPITDGTYGYVSPDRSVVLLPSEGGPHLERGTDVYVRVGRAPKATTWKSVVQAFKTLGAL